MEQEPVEEVSEISLTRNPRTLKEDKPAHIQKQVSVIKTYGRTMIKMGGSRSFNSPRAFHPSPRGEEDMALAKLHFHQAKASSEAECLQCMNYCVQQLGQMADSLLMEAASSLHLSPPPNPSRRPHRVL